ncbi:unnamed protein product, partial [Prorocentrum cordatum]
ESIEMGNPWRTWSISGLGNARGFGCNALDDRGLLRPLARMQHPTEVNRVAVCPQRAQLLASKAANGAVLLFDYKASRRRRRALTPRWLPAAQVPTALRSAGARSRPGSWPPAGTTAASACGTSRSVPRSGPPRRCRTAPRTRAPSATWASPAGGPPWWPPSATTGSCACGTRGPARAPSWSSACRTWTCCPWTGASSRSGPWRRPARTARSACGTCAPLGTCPARPRRFSGPRSTTSGATPATPSRFGGLRFGRACWPRAGRTRGCASGTSRRAAIPTGRIRRKGRIPPSCCCPTWATGRACRTSPGAPWTITWRAPWLRTTACRSGSPPRRFTSGTATTSERRRARPPRGQPNASARNEGQALRCGRGAPAPRRGRGGQLVQRRGRGG